MASLENTNVFIKTIISLLHNVIEETTPNLRSFLITILTKSVARLMPYCDDPIELLRDFSQFYNIGENVYVRVSLLSSKCMKSNTSRFAWRSKETRFMKLLKVLS